MNLALFDFDGTITNKDTFTAFVRFVTSPQRKVIGYVSLAPFILGYKAGVVSATRMRQLMVRVALSGMKTKKYHELGQIYCRRFLHTWLRKNALERIKWHLSSGDKVVIVSASLDGYLAPWCKSLGVELICSCLESKNDKLTGRYIEGDCTSSEKMRRILSSYSLDQFDKVYAYGDTQEDNEMLSLAHESYYQWVKQMTEK
ncbi:HAD family hydrolase [Cellvibrio sp. QJXJ]|uniref:HAD family hydrolase n=1 Tax=Cellvibrio sp. QJXJ TaxID=2964606 RepID=UPI0021C4AD46|nr:HAD family hydrolase [Cellvibrio sp. QJXJ]UUA73388.1 HAD-IB family hydrolase [Cellvibrio sp. QJXJ]